MNGIEPVRIAVAGLGRIGLHHIDAIFRNPEYATLAGVIDVNRELAEKVARDKGSRAFFSIKEAAGQSDIDAVIVCTPNHLHEEGTIPALEAGKAVLVEKPMTITGESADRMAAAAEKANVVLAVAQAQRFHSAIQYVADRMHTYGELNALQVSCCVRWDGPQAPWWRTISKEQGGLVLGLLIPHPLDFIQMVMGDAEPEEVYATAIRRQDEWVSEDESMVVLRYPGQKLVSLHMSYNQRPMLKRKSLLYHGNLVEILDDLDVFINHQPAPDFVPKPYIPLDDPIERRKHPQDIHAFNMQLVEFAKAVRGLPNKSVLHKDGARLIKLIDRIREVAYSKPIA